MGKQRDVQRRFEVAEESGPVDGTTELEAARVSLRAMLETKQRGDKITAAEIIEATGFENWRRFGGVIRTWAGKQFALFPVRNDGWRIGLASEHLDKARGHQKSAARSTKKRVEVLMSTPVSELDERHAGRHGGALISAQRVMEVVARDERESKEALLRDRPPRRPTTTALISQPQK